MMLTLPKKSFNLLNKKLLSLLMAFMATVMSFAQAASDVIQPPQEFDPSSWNWMNILICSLILLIVLVIARAFDIGSLAEKITGKKIVNPNKVNGIVGIVVLILGFVGVWYEMKYHGKFLLLWDAASEHGAELDSMFMWTFGFTFFVFIKKDFLIISQRRNIRHQVRIDWFFATHLFCCQSNTNWRVILSFTSSHQIFLTVEPGIFEARPNTSFQDGLRLISLFFQSPTSPGEGQVDGSLQSLIHSGLSFFH